jgi:hypothetical protein
VLDRLGRDTNYAGMSKDHHDDPVHAILALGLQENAGAEIVEGS